MHRSFRRLHLRDSLHSDQTTNAKPINAEQWRPEDLQTGHSGTEYLKMKTVHKTTNQSLSTCENTRKTAKGTTPAPHPKTLNLQTPKSPTPWPVRIPVQLSETLGLLAGRPLLQSSASQLGTRPSECSFWVYGLGLRVLGFRV